MVAVAAARLAAAAERLARAQVAEARAVDGLTWEQVGEAFGTTRQSAHERFRV